MRDTLRLDLALPSVFIIAIIVLAASFLPDTFVNVLSSAQNWILTYFDWLFDWTVFIMLAVCVWVYVSPLGKSVIGGDNAQPLLPKSRWFAIVLCTTIATGLLFWGCAEPLYHLHEQPYGTD